MPSGIDQFIDATSQLAQHFPLTPRGTTDFVLTLSDYCAYIRLQDVRYPYRFLRQMEGNPRMRFATGGFKNGLVDDENPARHYTAFLFVGFWLPNGVGLVALWLWELAGSVRYGAWSQADIRMGYVGLYHGRLVRRYGHTILPSLMARDLVESGGWSRLPEPGAGG